MERAEINDPEKKKKKLCGSVNRRMEVMSGNSEIEKVKKLEGYLGGGFHGL